MSTYHVLKTGLFLPHLLKVRYENSSSSKYPNPSATHKKIESVHKITWLSLHVFADPSFLNAPIIDTGVLADNKRANPFRLLNNRSESINREKFFTENSAMARLRDILSKLGASRPLKYTHQARLTVPQNCRIWWLPESGPYNFHKSFLNVCISNKRHIVITQLWSLTWTCE